MFYVVLFIVCWLGLGVIGSYLGDSGLQKIVFYRPKRIYIFYGVMALFGPINLITVYITFRKELKGG